MATPDRLPASEDTESGKSPHYGLPISPSTISTKTSSPAPKSADEQANKVLQKAFGPISPSAKKATASGRKHRTRKSKKHARKTKKHLRRK